MLFFDLAAAVNMVLGAVAGGATSALGNWTSDRSVRHRLREGFCSAISRCDDLDEEARDELTELVRSTDLLRYLTEGAGPEHPSIEVTAWEAILRRQPPAAVESLQLDLEAAAIDISVRNLSVPDRILHARTRQLRRRLEQTQTREHATALNRELATRIHQLTELVTQLAAAAATTSDARVRVADRVEEYRNRVILPLAQVDFEGRDFELAQIAQFVLGQQVSQWWWWVAGPWAGKTTVMARLATEPPEQVRVASMFIIGRQVADADSDAFYAYLLPQLAELAGLPECDIPPDLQGRIAQFDRLLRMAAASAAVRDERVLIVLDGLDEDHGAVATASRKQSVAASIPAALPPNAYIVIASRGNPPLPRDVPSGHPLRSIRTDLLVASPAAKAARELATAEINAILDTSDGGGTPYGRDALAFMAASDGQLTIRDLADLTGQGVRTIERLLTGVTGRSFNVRDTDEDVVFSLGHEVLDEEVVTHHLGYRIPPAHAADSEFAQDTYRRQRHVALAPWRKRIADWARTWGDERWPSHTPTYLTSAAVSTILASDSSLQEQAIEVLLDSDRSTLIRSRHGAHAEQAELRSAASVLLDSWGSGETSLFRLARILNRLDDLRASLISASMAAVTGAGAPRDEATTPEGGARAAGPVGDEHVADGSTTGARTMDAVASIEAARANTSSRVKRSWRTKALAQVVPALARAGYSAQAFDIVGRISEPASTVAPLASMAAVLAASRDERGARRAAADAHAAARSIRDPEERVDALVLTVSGLVAAGESEAALQAANDAASAARTLLVHPASDARAERKIRALVRAVSGLVAAGDRCESVRVAQDALAVAQSMPTARWREHCSVEVCAALALAGDAEAALTVAGSIGDGGWKCEALAGVVPALLAVFDPDTARDVALRLLLAAKSLINVNEKAEALSLAASCLVAVGNLDDAREAAHEAASAARWIQQASQRHQALSAVAIALATAGDSAAGLALIGSVGHGSWRCRAFLEVARGLLTVGDADGAWNAMQEALGAARWIEVGESKRQALGALAGLLAQMMTRDLERRPEARNEGRSAEDWRVFLGQIWVQAEQPWLGWDSLPDLMPTRVHEIVDLLIEESVE